MSEQLTTNTPPASVTAEHVRQALEILGLGFEGVTEVHIYPASAASWVGAATVRTYWIDGSGESRVAETAVTS